MAEITLENLNRTARDLYQKGLAALERNNFDYAAEMFRQCLEQEPGFLKGRQYLRAAQMKRTESSGGFKRMFVSTKTAPMLAKAQVVVSKNPVEAMGLAEQILSEDPKNSAALQLLSRAAEAAKFPEITIQTLEHYTKLHPRDLKALHWLARTYGVIGRHDLARDAYDLILQADPSDFEAQKGAKDAEAHGAMQTGGWEQAGSYRDVIKNKEEAVALEQESRVVRAEDHIENLIKENLAKLARDPGNPVTERELGKLYSQKGDHDTALSYFEKIYAAEGGADSSLEREIADVKIKRIQSQIEAKKQQRTIAPANATALQEEIAALQKEHDRVMLAQTERLVERYPNELMYRYDLAVLYMKLGKIQEAIEQFQRAVGQPQRRIAALNNLGQCFFQLELFDLAADQYRKALEELPMMDGVKKEVTYNLGVAYEAMKDNEQATAEFKKIAAVDFAYRDVRERIIRKSSQKTAS